MRTYFLPMVKFEYKIYLADPNGLDIVQLIYFLSNSYDLSEISVVEFVDAG